MVDQIKTLLAGKFITFMLQYFLTFVVFIKKDDNVKYTNYSSESDAETSLIVCLILSIVCQTVEFFSLLTGLSIFFDRTNVFSITFQSIGVLFTAWFILDKWPAELLWAVWAFGVLIPFILEIFIIIFSKKLHSSQIKLEEDQEKVGSN